MTSMANYINLYSTRAHVFQINTKTKNSWVSLSKGDSAIPISFVMSQTNPANAPNNKRELKLIGTSDDGQVLDCVISWDTVFNKRSHKFVQWPDINGLIYGLGFDSETDLDDFIEAFTELQQKTLSSVNSLVGRQQTNWSSSHQQILNPSETNGRAVAEYNANTLGRMSSTANTSAQYSNTSGYIAANSTTEHSANNNGGSEDTARHPLRSQSTAGLQMNKSNGAFGDGSGLVTNISRPSPDAADEAHHTEHQIREQLKYENERLKQALEESSKSASLWQNELLNLRTNNVKLTQALQDSKAHVAEWEKELLSVRDENKDLKLRLMALESMNDSSKSDEYKCELQKYKNYIENIQSELRKKENEVEDLQRSMEKMEIQANTTREGGSTSELLNTTGDLRQKLDIINAKLEAKADELVNVQKEFAKLIDQLH